MYSMLPSACSHAAVMLGGGDAVALGEGVGGCSMKAYRTVAMVLHSDTSLPGPGGGGAHRARVPFRATNFSPRDGQAQSQVLFGPPPSAPPPTPTCTT